MAPRFQAPRGTHDILPDEIGAWRRIESATREVFERYGFREIRTPIFESTELFTRSVGSSTDIVRKEMFALATAGESMTLRPEATAPVVRAFVEHALYRTIAEGYPERLYYIGPMFRHEKPQKGRQHQFHQLGVEVLGAEEPLADAETIEMVWSLLTSLGIEDRELRLNSIGDEDTRGRYRAALSDWLAPNLPRLCEDCRRRAQDNPLRVFDCKVEADRRLLSGAPSVLDHLSPAAAEHFTAVRSALDAYGVPYVVDPRLVRGLDYYRRTVFEVVSTGLGAQNAILGGGRYDGLVEELGGPAVPGFGFAAGMERLAMLASRGGEGASATDILLVALGPEGFAAAVGLARRLRARGLSIVSPLAPRPLSAQLKRAERLRARFALFVGEGELGRGRFGLKDLATGEQIDVDEDGIDAAVRKA
jgi:histidyl-tRNA synthetase